MSVVESVKNAAVKAKIRFDNVAGVRLPVRPLLPPPPSPLPVMEPCPEIYRQIRRYFLSYFF